MRPLSRVAFSTALNQGSRIWALPAKAAGVPQAEGWLSFGLTPVAARRAARRALLGLPDLRVLEWPDGDEDLEHGLHWKTMHLTQWADGRPFAWLDDEITDADRRRVAAHHPAPTLLRCVDPYVGLTEADFSSIRQWLAWSEGAA